jgi:hypothetical protein
MSSPKALVIEYEDGSSKRTEFRELNRETWLALSKLKLCPPPVVTKSSDHYVLLRWKDGWKEVVGIPKKAPELLRFYTVERTEEVGRMAFHLAEDYPMLFLVKRLPKEIERLLLVGPGEAREYVLEDKKTIKEGGKIEHILYDRKDSGRGEQEGKGAEAWVAELANSLKTELKKKGLAPEKLSLLDEAEKARAYQELSKTLGIRGMEKQEDVQGFLQFMIESRLGSQK